MRRPGPQARRIDGELHTDLRPCRRIADRRRGAAPGAARRPSRRHQRHHRRSVQAARDDLGWRAAFVAGLVVAPLVYGIAGGSIAPATVASSPAILIVAGLLVGSARGSAAGARAAGKPEGEILIPLTEYKVHAAEIANQAAATALTVAGGYGYRRGPLERYFRDARAAIAMGPSNTIAREWVGKVQVGHPLELFYEGGE